MTGKEQIEIIKGLIEATKELNSEYQNGWDDEIYKGDELIKFLENQTKTKTKQKSK